MTKIVQTIDTAIAALANVKIEYDNIKDILVNKTSPCVTCYSCNPWTCAGCKHLLEFTESIKNKKVSEEEKQVIDKINEFKDYILENFEFIEDSKYEI